MYRSPMSCVIAELKAEAEARAVFKTIEEYDEYATAAAARPLVSRAAEGAALHRQVSATLDRPQRAMDSYQRSLSVCAIGPRGDHLYGHSMEKERRERQKYGMPQEAQLTLPQLREVERQKERERALKRERREYYARVDNKIEQTMLGELGLNPHASQARARLAALRDINARPPGGG